MVDAHAEDFQSVILLQKGLPVRNRTHFNGGEHRLAENAFIEQILQRAHRLITAHIGVDGNFLAAFIGKIRNLFCIFQRHRDRFLAKDALDVVAFDRFADDVKLLIRRVGDIEYLDRLVIQQHLPCVIHIRNLMTLGDCPGM